MACGAPVCIVPPEELRLTRLVDFEDLPTSAGIGREIDGALQRPGVAFGERFVGQALAAAGDFDRLEGAPSAPLAVLPGARKRNLGSMRLPGSIVLHGLGPRGFPRAEAAGEGAIAIWFARDQPALSFLVPGGEQGLATVTFYARDGRRIARLTLGPLTGGGYGFHRAGMVADIAGVTVENDDPEGIAIDDLRFEADDLTG